MTAIDDRYVETGEERGPLGESVSEELPCGDGVGRWRAYARGVIVWSPRTGAWPVPGGVEDEWRSNGAEQGQVGYPIGDAIELGDRRGLAYPFDGGYIVVDPRGTDVEFTPATPSGIDTAVLLMLEVRRRGPNPLVGAVVHALRRALDGQPPRTDLERALGGQVDPNEIDLATLRRAVETFDALPDDVRRPLTPVALRRQATIDTPAEFPDAAELGRAAALARTRPAAPAHAELTRATGSRLAHQLELADEANAHLLTKLRLRDLSPHGTTTLLPAENEAWAGLVAGYRPWLERLEPTGAQPGDAVWVIGENFDPVPQANQLRLFMRAPDGSLAALPTSPTVVMGSTTVLGFKLPASLQAGYFALRVARTNPLDSSEVVSDPIFFSIKLPPPTITSITPPDPEPGHEVTIQGQNFQPKMMLRIEGTQGQFDVHAFMKTGDGDLTYVSPTQLTMRVPVMNNPGMYRVQVREDMGMVSSGLWSDWFNGPNVQPARFKVTFVHFLCWVTTKERTKDEIIFTWDIGCDGDVWVKTTTEYGSIVARNAPYGFTTEEGAVFPPIAGHDGSVRRNLWVSTHMWENDSPSEGQAVVKWLGKVAGAINAKTEDPYTYAVAAGAPLLAEALPFIFGLFGAGVSEIGTEDFFYEAWRLQFLTDLFPSHIPVVLTKFYGQGGIYAVYAQIRRLG